MRGMRGTHPTEGSVPVEGKCCMRGACVRVSVFGWRWICKAMSHGRVPGGSAHLPSQPMANPQMKDPFM